MDNNENCCLAKILKVIDILQRESTCENLPEGCERPFLGSVNGSILYNTRPITLYSRNGNLFTVSYLDNGTVATSSIFRVEKVKGCCATLRILTPNSIDPGTTYTSTGEFVTVNLECFCVLKCLSDTFVEI